ncbi:ribose/xylose/arabinose/galactoside ABC-type transport system permease subunit [Pseudomonas sp. W3I7]|nr:ribose/xylose/arabinose/galactoside ABC-type transport system permease subunit [Pseudomonas sp. W3I7]
MKTTSSPGKTGGNFYGLGTYLGLAGALLAMIALFSVLSDHFLSYDTFSTLANQIPDLMVLAVGMTFILIIGGIDLSVGSVLALAASAVSVAILGWGWSVLPAPRCWGWAAPHWQAPSPVRLPWPGAFRRLSCPLACWKWRVAWPTR